MLNNNKISRSLAVIAALVVMVLPACTGPRQAIQGPVPQENKVSTGMEAHGIKVVRIGHAVNGMMLDLRYRITDFELARKVLKQNTPLSIVDQATGKVLAIAESDTVGRLRNVPQNEDSSKVYWMFFVNPGGAVRPGSTVSLVIGDVQIRGITVE